jgi:histidinol-phosphatase (PHP family)
MIATYHNHSNFSDGTASIAELVGGARRLAVEELGISDHFVLHPTGRTPVWAMAPGRLAEYVPEVRAQQGATGPVVRLGLEVDWFPRQAEAIGAALGGHEFDYLIGAVHEIDGFRIDAAPDEWEALSPPQRDDRYRLYWDRIRTLAESGLFDIVAHLDLPKKFGYRPTADLDAEIGAALDAIARSGMVVELNTAGWHRPCRDGYPSLELVKACRGRNIPMTLSADAHEPDHLLRDFPRGAARLMKAGCEEVARFAGRRITFEHVEAAVARF